jgi:hypothetical protein
LRRYWNLQHGRLGFAPGRDRRFLDCGKVVKALSVASVSLRDGNNVKRRDVEARNTHQPITFRARVFPVSLNLSVEMRDGIALACRVDLLSALRQRFATRRIPAEIRNFTTLLNSGDTAALDPGGRHAPVSTKPGVHFNRWQGRTRVGLVTKLLAEAGRDVTFASSRPGAGHTAGVPIAVCLNRGGHPKHVCQMCANSAKASYIRPCMTDAATFTIC